MLSFEEEEEDPGLETTATVLSTYWIFSYTCVGSMKPFDETRREEEKRRREWERARGVSKDSMQASGERLASGWGRVVLRSREGLVGLVDERWRELTKAQWLREAGISDAVELLVWHFLDGGGHCEGRRISVQ